MDQTYGIGKKSQIALPEIFFFYVPQKKLLSSNSGYETV